MAFFFGDGFDLYTNLNDCGTYWDASFGATDLFAIVPGRFPGSRGLNGIGYGGGAAPYLFKTSGVNDPVHHISVAWQTGSSFGGPGPGFVITFTDGATAQCTLAFLNANIMLLAGNQNGAALATYSNAAPAFNTWYQFECEVVISSTAGSLAVRKLGNTVNDFFLGSLNTQASANAYANKIQFGYSNVNITGGVIDDFLWRSGASGAVPWVGDIRCYTRMPASDSSVQWTPSSSGPSSALIGTNGSTQSMTANAAVYTPFTAIANGTLGSITSPVNGASTASTKLTLFADNAGLPGAIIASANVVTAPGVGACTHTFPTPPSVVQGTKYWLGFCNSASSGSWTGVTVSGSNVSYYNNSTTYTSFPTANPPSLSSGGNGVNATIVITVTSANAWLVAEPQQDGATTYVYSNTVGQSDLYTIGAAPVTPGAIIGVTTRGYLEKSDAGTRVTKLQLQSGATNVQTSGLVLNTIWGWDWRNDVVDPATGTAWTPTGVNNVKIGVTVSS